MEMLSAGTAGQGAGAAHRPARGSVDRHRPLRVRRAQRAAGHDRDGTGRHVRAAVDAVRTCYALRDRVRCGMAARGPALFSVFAGSPVDATRAAAVSDRGRGDEVARLPGVHLRRERRQQLGHAILAREQPATPSPTGRSRPSNTPTRRCSASARTCASPTPTSCCATGATPHISPSCRASAGLRRCCRWPTGWR